MTNNWWGVELMTDDKKLVYIAPALSVKDCSLYQNCNPDDVISNRNCITIYNLMASLTRVNSSTPYTPDTTSKTVTYKS